MPSKIRFPRVTIPCQFFEPLSDESILSFYAVNTETNTGIIMTASCSNSHNFSCLHHAYTHYSGIFTFCSFCGVHILFSPSIDPTELQVNIDCIDRSTVDGVTVTYHSCPDSVPARSHSHYEATKVLNKVRIRAIRLSLIRPALTTPRTLSPV